MEKMLNKTTSDSQLKYSVQDLLIDSRELNEKIASAIYPYVRIHKQTLDILLNGAADFDLSIEEKILVYALAKKLLKLEYPNLVKSEAITALELHTKLGVKKGSIDSAFLRLKTGSRYLVGKKSYELPTRFVDEIIYGMSLLKLQEK